MSTAADLRAACPFKEPPDGQYVGGGCAGSEGTGQHCAGPACTQPRCLQGHVQVIRVLIADSHPIMREGLRYVLSRAPDIEVVGETWHGGDLLRLTRDLVADVLLLDLSLSGRSGLELIRQLHAELPRLRILVLTVHTEAHYVMRAFRWGAAGYLSKTSSAAELIVALRKVSAGGTYVSPSVADSLANGVHEYFDDMRHTHLSDRELEVFRRIVAGQSLSEIASALHVSAKTISTHKMRLLMKMRLRSDAALIRYAVEAKLFDD